MYLYRIARTVNKISQSLALAGLVLVLMGEPGAVLLVVGVLGFIITWNATRIRPVLIYVPKWEINALLWIRRLTGVYTGVGAAVATLIAAYAWNFTPWSALVPLALLVMWLRRAQPLVISSGPRGLHYETRRPDPASIHIATTVPYPSPWDVAHPVYTNVPHIITYAPSGAGKSSSVMCAMQEWQGQLVIVDPKGEFWREQQAQRGRTARLWSTVASVDPVGILELVGGIAEFGNALEAALEPDPGNAQRSAPFNRPAITALVAYMRYAQHHGAPPIQAAVQVHDHIGVLQEIAESGQPGSEDAASVLSAAGSAGYMGSIVGTIGRIQAILRPIARALDGPPIDAQTDVYIYIPADAMQTPTDPGAVVARLLVQAVWSWKLRLERAGAVHPTLLVVDEAAVMATPALATIGRMGRSAGVRLWILAQSAESIESNPILAPMLTDAGAVAILQPPDVTSRLWELLVGKIPGFLLELGRAQVLQAIANDIIRANAAILHVRGDVGLVRFPTPRRGATTEIPPGDTRINEVRLWQGMGASRPSTGQRQINLLD